MPDLPQVIAIERRSSRRVVAGDWSCSSSSKDVGDLPGSTVNGRVEGYLVCSRYDAVWHS